MQGSIVYVADSSAHRIVELNATTGAIVKTIANVADPEGIAVTPAGTIWVAETGQNALGEFSAAGALLQRFGTAGSGNTQFNHPAHVEIAGGRLYVADEWNDRVQVFKLNDQ